MPEGDFSSPRDKLKVCSLEAVAGRQQKTRIRLSDNSTLTVLSEVLIERRICAGDEIAPPVLDALRAESHTFEAINCAQSLIARYQHSKRRLALKLSLRGYPGDVIRRALAKLEEGGLLDDTAFAEEWVRLRLGRRPEGRLALVAGLRKRGIERQIAEEAVQRLVSEEDEYQSAVCLVEDLLSYRAAARVADNEGVADNGNAEMSRASTDTLRRKLYARGFSVRVINRALRNAEFEVPD